jgi:hypothetical protein
VRSRFGNDETELKIALGEEQDHGILATNKRPLGLVVDESLVCYKIMRLNSDFVLGF